MLKKPTVSVILPTCNRPEMLKQAFESIITQDYDNITEIIISDDSNNEETYKLVKDFQRKDKRVIYTKNTKYKKGPSGNKQNAIDLVSGEFVTGIDDDDILLPYAISECIKVYLREGGKYSIIFGNCQRSDNNELTGKHYGKDEKVEYTDFLCGRFDGEYCGVGKSDIFRNIKLIDKLGGFESTGGWLLWKNKNLKGYYVHKVMRIYRIHQSQFSNQYYENSEQTFNGYELHIKTYKEDWLKYCPDRLIKIALLTSFLAKISGKYSTGINYNLKAIKIKPTKIFSWLLLFFNVLPLPKKLALKIHAIWKNFSGGFDKI